MTGKSDLAMRARVLLTCFTAAGSAALVWAVMNVHTSTRGWITFAVLGTGAAIAQLFPVMTPRHNAFTMSVVFTLPGMFLLPLPLVMVLPIVQLLPEWLKERYPWYMVAFNASNWILNLLAGWAVLTGVKHTVHGHPGFALAAFLAVITVGALNHVAVAGMIAAAQPQHTLRSTDLLTFYSLSNEAMLGFVGVAVASFWMWNPWFVPVALAPLLLIQRSIAMESLKEEARVDAKTSLFNARHFAAALGEELARAERFQRPLAVVMADLDLLRDINNTYGHLAGDAVLRGIANVFRSELRHYDVPARFGGEEFSILLPETTPEEAFEIAERIRRAVAARSFEVETSEQPIRATVSIGVASFPQDGVDANELLHQADLAVYRAKLQGRNRVIASSPEPLLLPDERSPRLVAVPDDPVELPQPVAAALQSSPPAAIATRVEDDRRKPRPHLARGPRFFALSVRLGAIVALVSGLGVAVGIGGIVFGSSTDWKGLLAVVALVGAGQALMLEYDSAEGSISVSAVGALAGAAIVGPRAALALALTIALVDWSARRPSLHQVIFNVGLLSLATTGAAMIFQAAPVLHGNSHRAELVVVGAVAGIAYYLINMGLVSLALAVEGHDNVVRVFRERFAWLALHYVGYGFIGAAIALAYEFVSLVGLGVFAVPLLLMRKTQQAYLVHTERSAQKLRRAAETIQSQNVSLEQANRLLKERSTAAMESLSATVDARDSYTAGHSRRVQQLALAIGRELDLSQAELDLLGHAALFHDIGKLAIPDAILLKPASLTEDEWRLMQRHADEGARIIDRLGFLQDAVPAIRHHHECWDGSGYPDGLEGEDIPLGARIIHVADALDSMLTTRIYRAARPAHEAIAELRRRAGTQFCPRCVGALERILPDEDIPGSDIPAGSLAFVLTGVAS